MTRRRRPLEFIAELSGRNEVPPVRTDASGAALICVNADRTIIQVRLFVSDIRNVTEAHIHLGERGENGPVVAFLFGPSDPIDVKDEELLSARTITRGDLVGPLAGQPLSTLVTAMRQGNAYVNVHTVQNPEGEIRGQIERR